MDLPDFASGYWPVLLILIFFIIITGRYFFVAGLFYFIFYIWFPAKWKERKINQKEYRKGQFKKEIKWSLVSSLLFSAAGAITLILWQKGYTKVYIELNEYGWWYLPVSLVIFMLLHETYYYWIHRWMHIPSVFKIVHKIHHDSYIASPFTAFSFHPIEAFFQAVFLPVVLIILPIHYYVIIVLLIIMTFSSVINHLNIEIYPKSFHTFRKWIIGATHHSLHHKQYKYNFGLYFTFWDRMKKTESPEFEKLLKTRD
ncbi:MAG: sterol desaturase family protein [Bacteroidota bacterium]|nr:sterol desaturase family protein [Bacteroidota bacterium]